MIIAYRTFRIANLDVFPSQSAAIVSYAKRVTPHLAGARIWHRQTTKFGTASLYQKADEEMAKLSGREESVKAVRAYLVVTCPNIVDSLLIILDAMSEDNPVMEFSA